MACASPTEIVDRVAAAFNEGRPDGEIVAQLGQLGLAADEANHAIEMVRSGFCRVLLLIAGMKSGQFCSDYESDPIFQAAIRRARRELTHIDQPRPRKLAEIREALTEADADQRAIAAYELGRSGNPLGEPLLLAMIDDCDQMVRITAIQALGDCICLEAVPRLSEILAEDQDRLVLSNAIRALVDIGDRDAVPALIQATRHEDAKIRHDVAWALGQFRDKRAIPALEALLNDTTVPETRDENGILSQTSIFSIRDHAERSLKRIRAPWWKFW